MSLFAKLIDIVVHLDKHLGALIGRYEIWTYLILFVVIFCETGLVVTPFLPGDSLLFACGSFASLGTFEFFKVGWVFLALSMAAVLGDTVNYWIGHAMGPKVFQKTDSRIFRKEYLDRTHAFYEKHGGATIIIARFVPIIRTFAPFVAGIGKMSYGRFIAYNVVGGVSWVALFVFGGYFFGNIPLVKKNFSLVIFMIIAISMVPGVVEYLRHRRKARASETRG
jgi:membrane-associated protein